LQRCSLWNTELDNPEGAELSCSCRVTTAEVLSCTASTEIITLASITQHINFKLATLAFKVQSTSQPEYLRQLISSQHSGSSMTVTLRSSTRPATPGTTHQNVPAYGGRALPAIWNNLPTSVIEASSLPVFRRRLKTHLFTVAFTASG